MKPSSIRQLLKLAGRPGMVSLAGGLPAAELFPIAELEAATQAVLQKHGPRALQYGETEGLAALRDWLAAIYWKSGAALKRENVLITTGAQQGLDLLGRVLLEDGDKVIVENPTYLAAISAWRPLGVEFLTVPTDDDGMRVDGVEALLAQKPKVLYTTPNFQNPTGTTLPLDRREKLVELTRAANLPIIEDDPYGDLYYDDAPPESLFQLARRGGAEAHVATLGTISKILAPSLRVGWVVASEELIDKLALAKQAADLQSSTFNQYIVMEMAQRGFLNGIPKLRDVYRVRRDAMLVALAEHFPKEAHWTKPTGGLFVWVTLPKQISAMELLPKAVEHNVTFVPGEDFHCDGSGKNTMRLNFSNASVENIRTAIERLGQVIRAAL